MFISDTKSYAEYMADLNLWSRITSLEKKLQADVVVYRLEGHPTRIKEKITTQLGDTLQNNEDGIKELLIFMDSIFLEDDMADAWTSSVSLLLSSENLTNRWPYSLLNGRTAITKQKR